MIYDYTNFSAYSHSAIYLLCRYWGIENSFSILNFKQFQRLRRLRHFQFWIPQHTDIIWNQISPATIISDCTKKLKCFTNRKIAKYSSFLKYSSCHIWWNWHLVWVQWYLPIVQSFAIKPYFDRGRPQSCCNEKVLTHQGCPEQSLFPLRYCIA